MGLCWYLFALSVGDEFSLICKMVIGYVIICGLIFVVGVVVSQVGAVGWHASTCLQIEICGLIHWSIFVVVLAYQNLWVDYLVWVNSLVNFYGLICLVWIYFCVVGVVFVMGWGMFKEVLINLGLIFFFFFLWNRIWICYLFFVSLWRLLLQAIPKQIKGCCVLNNRPRKRNQ